MLCSSWVSHFSLRMYTTCTFQLAKALDFEPLMWIPRVFIYLTIVAWVAAFAGLIYTLIPKQSQDPAAG